MCVCVCVCIILVYLYLLPSLCIIYLFCFINSNSRVFGQKREGPPDTQTPTLRCRPPMSGIVCGWVSGWLDVLRLGLHAGGEKFVHHFCSDGLSVWVVVEW